MAYMQLEYHNPSAELTPQEVMHIRREAAAREQEIVAASRALRHITESGEGSADLHRVLDRLSALTCTTRVPKRFIVETPKMRLATSRSKQHDRLFHRETHNHAYIRRLRRQHCRQRKTSVIEDHYFQVPTSPLPLSFAAQQDSARARGSQGRRRGQASSGYAPLFTKASTTPLSSRELSPVERDALKFLTPSKRSPKAATLEKLEAQAQYAPSNPRTRVLFNEPKKMPNLHRRVPPNFKAACAEKYTCSFANHCAGKEERVAQNRAEKDITLWH
jgi:hypothetical protein